MTKTHVKRGDEVVVLSGKEKGKRGKILEILSAKDRAVVEGLMMIKRHMKKTEENPEGQIVEKEGSIHISNLMLASKWDERHAG
ncbi:50S ribosomal protein L24 [Puniceicoccaceae bacterium K14]|nr:50S ribosomal protein L24 [Puniceicoccaceae bacterium K14]